MPARLAQHLAARGLVSAATVEEAQRRRATHGGGLDTALLELGAIAEAELLQALGEVSGLKPVNLADFEPNAEMARFVPANVAERLGAVPLSLDGATLHVATAYPPAQRDLEEVALLLGKKLETWIAIEVRVRDWLTSIYGVELPPRYSALLSGIDPARASPAAPTPPPPEPIPLSSFREEQVAPPAPALGTRGSAAAKPELVPVTVQEPTLEDALTREMVEQIARVVAEEPILLEVRKKPKPAPASPPPARRPVPPAPVAAPVAPLVVFPNPTEPTPAPAPPPPRIDPAPAPAAPSAAPEWTLQQARAALKEASQDRDRIIQIALTFARRAFDFAAAFAVVRGAAVGWAAQGEGAEAFQQAPPSIPLDSASVFRTVAMTRGSYVGPVPPDALSAQYLAAMGRSPRLIFLFPVEVKERLVVLLYGDPGSRPISQRKLSDLLLFSQDLPGAFQELILQRKQRFGATQAAALGLEEMIRRPATTSLGWSPSVTGGHEGLGRIAGIAGVIEDPSRPPPDFAPLLRKLTGWDASARAAAIAELARTPEASSRALTQSFPGPTAWSRLPVSELPEADELGPIPAALSRLGRAGAQALAPLLDADDPDVRYFALLTAGNLPFPELVGGVLRGLFDFEPDLSSAARAAAAALRRLPRFVDAMRDLRQELAAVDPIRRSLAARALGVLHDRESIEGLINLTGSDDGLCAQAAADALREITRASFGPDQRRWTAWWAEHRTRSRGEWLVAALRHPDVDVRLGAIEELSRALNDNLGYFADAPLAERHAAAKSWEAAVAGNPRLRRLE